MAATWRDSTTQKQNCPSQQLYVPQFHSNPNNNNIHHSPYNNNNNRTHFPFNDSLHYNTFNHPTPRPPRRRGGYEVDSSSLRVEDEGCI